MLLDLNERFPLAGWVLTADALHTQRGFATLACEDLLAHYVLTVKGNQPGLYAALAGAVLGRRPPARHQRTRATAAARPAATSSWTPPTR